MISPHADGTLNRSIERFLKRERFGKVLTTNFYAVSITVFVLFLLASLLKTGSYTLDETVFHYPNLLNFYENGWGAMFNDQYSAANTPLPYIIVAVMAKLFSPSLILARVVTAIVSFSTFILFSKLLEGLSAPRYFSFVILFYPYLFVNSFVFYAINYGLFFLALALWQWYKNEKAKSLAGEFVTGLCFSAAVLCQQFYLAIPIAVIANRGMRLVLKNPETNFKQFTLSNVLLILPLLLPMCLFYAWGGLTHPNFDSHSLSFYPSTIVAILFVIGFYFSPYVFLRRKKITAVEAIASFLTSVVLVTFCRPVFSDIQGPGLFTGLVFHIISFPSGINPWITNTLMTILTTSGLLVIIQMIRSLTTRIDFGLATISAFLVLVYSVNTQVGERHLAGLLMILFLIILPRMKNAGYLYPVAMSALGIGYFVYWYFFKFS